LKRMAPVTDMVLLSVLGVCWALLFLSAPS